MALRAENRAGSSGARQEDLREGVGLGLEDLGADVGLPGGVAPASSSATTSASCRSSAIAANAKILDCRMFDGGARRRWGKDEKNYAPKQPRENTWSPPVINTSSTPSTTATRPRTSEALE